MGLPNYPRPAFGPSGLRLRFGLAQRGLTIALGAPLLWAWRVGLRAHFSNPINVIFETYSQVVTTAIHVRSETTTEFGSIIQQCLAFLSHNASFSLVFVSCQANSLAHRLDRESIAYFSPVFWTEPPRFILPKLLFDKL